MGVRALIGDSLAPCSFLWELCRATGDERYFAGAVSCLDRLGEAAVGKGEGIMWPEPIPFSESHGHTGTTEILDVSRGSAGVGLSLLYAAARGLHESALEWATQVGDRLLEVAESPPGADEAQLEWPMMLDQPFDWTAPNFSHGTAGVAFFLARLFEVTKEQRYLEGALGGASRLAAVTSRPGEGAEQVCHNLERGRELFYVAWCHGPLGTGRLYHLLARLTDGSQWEERLRSLGAGLVALDVPERSRGYWNNRGQCCGDAGVGETFLMLARPRSRGHGQPGPCLAPRGRADRACHPR